MFPSINILPRLVLHDTACPYALLNLNLPQHVLQIDRVAHNERVLRAVILLGTTHVANLIVRQHRVGNGIRSSIVDPSTPRGLVTAHPDAYTRLNARPLLSRTCPPRVVRKCPSAGSTYACAGSALCPSAGMRSAGRTSRLSELRALKRRVWCVIALVQACFGVRKVLARGPSASGRSRMTGISYVNLGNALLLLLEKLLEARLLARELHV